MRFQRNLFLAGATVTVMMCSFLWPAHSCRNNACAISHFYGNEQLQARNSAYQAPELVYSEQIPATQEPVFKSGEARILRAESRIGWSYSDARFVPDCNGDGWMELALIARHQVQCGNTVHNGTVALVSGATQRPIGIYSGWFYFQLKTSAAGDLLMVHEGLYAEGALQMFDSLRSEPRWESETIWDEFAFVGDVDGDGIEDVAVSSPFASMVVDSENRKVGRVVLLSGADGRTLWRLDGSEPGVCLGRGLAPAGDRNDDGAPDVAAFSYTDVTILSGLDASQLDRLTFPPEVEIGSVEAVGDYDGDGFGEFMVTEVRPRRERRFVVYSSESWEPIDIGDGWRIQWATEGDPDGDGVDELILGRRDPESGERRISSYSRWGLRDLRTVADDEPEWRGVETANAGRFREGEAWQVLLVHPPPLWSMESSGSIDLVPLN